MPQQLREQQRITIPRVIEELEKQTGGAIGKEDFFSVPSVSPITEFVEGLVGEPKYNLSTHFACGMATYAIRGDDDAVTPITRFVDVDGLMAYLKEKAGRLKGGSNKYWTGLKVLAKLGSFVDKKKQPRGFNIARMLVSSLVKHNYRSLAKLHHQSLFIGMMHFQDLYNYDIERVKRCCIHYSQPDGTIIPFCAFNVIPQWYRDKIQKKYSTSIEEWEKKTGKKLSDDLYKRDAKKLEADPLYKETYSK